MTNLQKSSFPLLANLSTMMFLLFFVWGAWFAGLGGFMIKAGMSSAIGNAYSCTPIAAIITPFFIGFFADRFFNAEKLQGLLLLLSGVFLAIAPSFAKPETSTIFVWILLAHALCFMPTLSLSNTICLKHLANSEKEYPRVRIFATLGWIIAGLSISHIFHFDSSVYQLYVGAGVAFVVGIYSFFLPKTPPPGKGEKVNIGELIGAGTLPYFKKFSFAIFMFASLLLCVAFMPYWANLSGYLSQAGMTEYVGFLTWGQIAELPVLFFALPFFLNKVGIKWTMVIGVVCWILRYLLFSTSAGQLAGGSDLNGVYPLLLAGVLLHGFSYDFVFVSGYLYVDKHVNEKIRAQAQGLLTVFTQGIAFLISSKLLSGYYYNKIVGADGGFAEWKQFWMLPVGYLVVILILFIVFFRDKKTDEIPHQAQ
ncbi:MAG: MFS transporter [Verrucomicrobiota bacterium]